MGRRIVTVAFQARAGAREVDTYFDRVVKYIPADVVSAWVFVIATINSAPDDVPKAAIEWGAFAFGLLFTALWTWRQTQEPQRPPAVTQIAIATTAFAVWVLALGGPFATLSCYRPLYGSLGLVAYTLVAGLVIPRDSPPKR
jgi:hypothetical protein